MCAPDTDDSEANNPDPKATPTHWPDHLEEAICSMNDRILLALGLTPREMLWGRRETTNRQPTSGRIAETTENNVTCHLTFTDLLRSQGHTDALAEASRRKAWFDDKVHWVEFKPGDLVQVYDSKLNMTYETRAKLLPCWSPPRIVTDRLLNSYTLRRLDGTELNGMTHARRLRRFMP